MKEILEGLNKCINSLEFWEEQMEERILIEEIKPMAEELELPFPDICFMPEECIGKLLDKINIPEPKSPKPKYGLSERKYLEMTAF